MTNEALLKGMPKHGGPPDPAHGKQQGGAWRGAKEALSLTSFWDEVDPLPVHDERRRRLVTGPSISS